MIPELPCKDQKCILFPICKGKVEVKCQILFQYFQDISSDKQYPIQFAEIWDSLEPDLPLLTELHSETAIIDNTPFVFTFVKERIPYKRSIPK